MGDQMHYCKLGILSSLFTFVVLLQAANLDKEGLSHATKLADPPDEVVSASSGPEKGSRPPNIVIFLADDLGWHDVSYHGSEIQTPNIDKLALSGIRLENYYVQSVCSPSRAALMTGKYPIHLGLQHEVLYAAQRAGLPLQEKTLADQLKTHGYATHIVGKWHLGFFEEAYMPLRRGFDSWMGYLTGNEDYYTHESCESLGCGYDFRMDDSVDTYANGTYSTHLFTERAMEIIEKHDTSIPLFLYVPFQAVHFPLQVPDSYKEPYAFLTDAGRQTFAGMTSCMDEAIGNITDKLQEKQLWNNTIIIFSTDNGGETSYHGSNWPLRGKKWTLWEGGVRGLAFVHSPLLQDRAGEAHTHLMHISDWYPTILEGILGGEKTDQLDGFNLWPSLINGSAGDRLEVLLNIDILSPQPGVPQFNDTFPTNITAAIRVGDWKLLTGYPGDDRWFLPDHDEYSKHKHWLIDFLRKNEENFVAKYALLDYDVSYHEQVGSVPPKAKETVEQLKLREELYPNSRTKNVWLFNITADPEEVTDLSDSHPEVVKQLLDRLLFYNKTAVPANFPDEDPSAAPSQNEGVWGPWVRTFTGDIIKVMFKEAERVKKMLHI